MIGVYFHILVNTKHSCPNGELVNKGFVFNLALVKPGADDVLFKTCFINANPISIEIEFPCDLEFGFYPISVNVNFRVNKTFFSEVSEYMGLSRTIWPTE